MALCPSSRKSNKVAEQPWSAEIHLRFPIAHEFYGWLVIAARISGVARRVTTFERKHRQAARRVVSTGLTACGWLRGRRARPPAPLAGGGGRSGCGALPLAGAASPLTCPPGAANPSSPALRATPGGLRSLRSASSLPFLVTCRRQVIPSHSFAALTALVVRRVSGDAALFMYRVSGYVDRPMPCLYWLPARPPEGHWRAHPAAAPCRPRKW